MDEDESFLCLWVHIDVVYHGGAVSEGGAIFPGLRLTDFNGCRLICSAVYGWTSGGFVFPRERELGNCGSAEEGEGEGRQQHREGRGWCAS